MLTVTMSHQGILSKQLFCHHERSLSDYDDVWASILVASLQKLSGNCKLCHVNLLLMHKIESYLAWFRNLLISCGAFWFSLQFVKLLALLSGRAGAVITYRDGVGGAIAMGVMMSMGRAVCAAIGGAIVSFAAIGSKPHRWAAVVALLYLIASRPHFFFLDAKWYHWLHEAALFWPPVLCLVVAALIGRMQSTRPPATSNQNGT